MITKQKSLFVLLFVILICGCSKEDLNAQSSKQNGQGAIMNNQTGFTLSVPAEYTRQASQRGSVTRLDYTSKDYAGNGKAITKTAYVYTPYGYNEKGSERYDILYLMHGWGGHAGEYFEMAEIKNVFDNMISKGQIKPLIVVSATFYNANSGSDFGSSVAELRSFHNDFEKHLMPAVEGKYRTYAVSTSDADLKASRSHRAFGGFSLGSVTTWLEFCYDSDYISSFIPMSGSSWFYGGFGDFQIKKNVDFIEQLVIQNKLNERGYFIYHAVGTNDAVKEQSYMMAEEMLSRKIFSAEHYRFFQKQGGVHDHIAVREFLYNALPVIFPKKQTSESNNLVLVKGGTFLSTSDTKNPSDYTTHRETVEDFYISKYEVTVALYKSVTGKNPTSALDGTDEMKRPVENISGYDCIDFLNALSRLEGFDECYSFKNGKWTCDFSKNGYRLPTLPEWEYAARGGSLSKGYKYSGSDKISEVGWYDGNSGGHAHQVGLLKPNELGLYDMSGNVGERCWNPSYKGENPAHVGRGGCWIYYEGYCAPDYRFVTTENFKQDGLGIRLVRSKI